MKKLISAAIATVMAGAMSVSAFATELTTSPSNNNGAGDYTIGVDGIYVPGGNAEEKISVDIAWESMDFTYTAGDSSYDVTTHKTTAKDGSWSTNKPGITVTNHSNVAIDANMSFAATVSGVVGTFYTKSGDDFTAISTAANQKLSLESAEGKKRNDGQADDESPKGMLYFGVSGDAISEDKTLGTITVKIAKDTATRVTDKEGLKAALEAIKTTGGTVKLANNINVGSDKYFEINGGTETNPIILDLNGYTLTGLVISGRDITGNQTVTANVVIQNGTLECTSDSQNIEYAVVMSWGDIKLKDITVNATNYMAAGAAAGGKIEVVDSALNGGISFDGIKCTCMSIGGEFIFSGTVTIEGVIGMADYTSNNAKVTLKADGTYTFNGAEVAVIADTDYVVSDCDSADWLGKLT